MNNGLASATDWLVHLVSLVALGGGGGGSKVHSFAEGLAKRGPFTWTVNLVVWKAGKFIALVEGFAGTIPTVQKI